MRAKPWIICGAPLLWAGPAALGYAMMRVHPTLSEARLMALAAWAAVLCPIVGAVLMAIRLRPLGWLSILWMLLNVLLGVVVFGLIAVMALQT